MLAINVVWQANFIFRPVTQMCARRWKDGSMMAMTSFTGLTILDRAGKPMLTTNGLRLGACRTRSDHIQIVHMSVLALKLITIRPLGAQKWLSISWNLKQELSNLGFSPVNFFDPHHPFDAPESLLERYTEQLQEIPLPAYSEGELDSKPHGRGENTMRPMVATHSGK